MGIKAALSKPFAFFVSWQINRLRKNAVKFQDKIFVDLIKTGIKTAFGRDHHFAEIKTYEDFKKLVPIRDYEELKPYIDRVVLGEENVLWPGKPLYLAKTSGTTSGVKYIPISKNSMPQHIRAARNA
ncbi:MAG: hypothetical protein EOP44_00210, partial [Sphingobacteriaceae bacterium]